MGPKNPEEAKDQCPTSLRAQFGQSVLDNAVHGSSNSDNAEKIIHNFFPEEETAEGEGESPAQEGEAPAEGEAPPKPEAD